VKKDNKKPNKNNNYIIIICLMIVIALLLTLSAYFLTQDKKSKEDNEIAYTQLLKDIEENKVEKIEMTVGSVRLKVTYKERENDEDTKKVIIPSTQAFTEYIQEQVKNGKDFKLEPKTSGFLAVLSDNILSIISTALMITIVVMVFKMQGLGDKGKVYDETQNKTKITFKDVAGLKEEKEEMIEVVDFLKEPELLEKQMFHLYQ